MDKENFVQFLKNFKKDINALSKKIQKVTGKQIQSRTLLSDIEVLATKWFDEIETTIRSTYEVDNAIIAKYREPFGKILELIDGKPSKKALQSIFDGILSCFHVDILVPIQKHQAVLSKFPSLDKILSNAKGLEIDYLKEAIDCARAGKRRASIILGWCATVNRLHLYIEKNGFSKFNQASVQMSSIQTGRYKRFNKRFEIQNLSDLRMSVFDNDLLWILEFLGIIDGNQHERLQICFTLRNTCAHPGEAVVSEENALSFFSDIDVLVFSNPKFKLEEELNSQSQ